MHPCLGSIQRERLGTDPALGSVVWIHEERLGMDRAVGNRRCIVVICRNQNTRFLWYVFCIRGQKAASGVFFQKHIYAFQRLQRCFSRNMQVLPDPADGIIGALRGTGCGSDQDPPALRFHRAHRQANARNPEQVGLELVGRFSFQAVCPFRNAYSVIRLPVFNERQHRLGNQDAVHQADYKKSQIIFFHHIPVVFRRMLYRTKIGIFTG